MIAENQSAVSIRRRFGLRWDQGGGGVVRGGAKGGSMRRGRDDRGRSGARAPCGKQRRVAADAWGAASSKPLIDRWFATEEAQLRSCSPVSDMRFRKAIDAAPVLRQVGDDAVAKVGKHERDSPHLAGLGEASGG